MYKEFDKWWKNTYKSTVSTAEYLKAKNGWKAALEWAREQVDMPLAIQEELHDV